MRSIPPYHTNTSHADRSLDAVCHDIVPVTSSTPRPMSATIVTSRPCHTVVSHVMPTPTNTISVIHSLRLSGPILRSSSRANDGASGVCVISGLSVR